METLSPTLTLTLSTVPSYVEGTSTLDLSLSKVTIESFFFILSETLTKTSITSTSSKSPISGTNNCWFINMLIIYAKIIYWIYF